MPAIIGFLRDMQGPDFSLELAAHQSGLTIVAGVDEVGRGPLAGPVTAAAVVLDPECIPDGLNDSKKLAAARREELARVIEDCAVVRVAHATVEEIDEINILRASHLAMTRAIDTLPTRAQHLLIDGNMIPEGTEIDARCVVGGDALCLSISAASIVAKMWRDRVMWDLAQQFPGYGWETNVGYGTRAHMEGLRNIGVTPHHRRSFKPVHNILYQDDFVSD